MHKQSPIESITSIIPKKHETASLSQDIAATLVPSMLNFTLQNKNIIISRGGQNPTFGKGVLAYHMRQAFPHGEVTPEEANRIGHELAMRFTKGNHAFIVATHIDRNHHHNHIFLIQQLSTTQESFVISGVRRWRFGISAIPFALKTDYLLSKIQNQAKARIITNGSAKIEFPLFKKNCEM